MKWESEDVCSAFIKYSFPDFRKMISNIQDLQTREVSVITIEDVKNSVYTYTDIFNAMVSKTDSLENYKLVMSEYQNKIAEVISSISNEFPNWLKETHPTLLNKLSDVLVIVATWEANRHSMIDPALALLAIIYESQKIFKGS